MSVGFCAAFVFSSLSHLPKTHHRVRVHAVQGAPVDALLARAEAERGGRGWGGRRGWARRRVAGRHDGFLLLRPGGGDGQKERVRGRRRERCARTLAFSAKKKERKKTPRVRGRARRVLRPRHTASSPACAALDAARTRTHTLSLRVCGTLCPNTPLAATNLTATHAFSLGTAPLRPTHMTVAVPQVRARGTILRRCGGGVVDAKARAGRTTLCLFFPSRAALSCHRRAQRRSCAVAPPAPPSHPSPPAPARLGEVSLSCSCTGGGG